MTWSRRGSAPVRGACESRRQLGGGIAAGGVQLGLREEQAVAQVGPADVGITEVRADEVGRSQVGLPQIGGDQEGAAQAGGP